MRAMLQMKKLDIAALKASARSRLNVFLLDGRGG